MNNTYINIYQKIINVFNLFVFVSVNITYIYLFDQIHYHNYIFNIMTTNFNPYFCYKNIIKVR